MADATGATAAHATTLADVLNAYVRYRTSGRNVRKRLKTSTAAEYREIVEDVCEDWLALPIVTITRAMVMDRHAQYSKSAPARADGAMRVLRALANYWIDRHEDVDGFVWRNPVSAITKRFNKPAARTTRLNETTLPLWWTTVTALPAKGATPPICCCC